MGPGLENGWFRVGDSLGVDGWVSVWGWDIVFSLYLVRFDVISK